jgi:ABC-2 type transport system permease protein
MASRSAGYPSTAIRPPGWAARLSTFAAMARKEFTIMLRYPVEFVASFGQIFAIVAIFTLAGLTFSRGTPTGPNPTGGLVVYGLVLFLFLSDTLWGIGYNIRRELKQGTLEQLYLSPASKFASLASRVTNTLVWTGLLSVAAAALMSAMLGSLPFAHPGLAALIFVFTLAGTFGVGFAFAALTLRIGEAGQTAANGLQFVLLILCGNFFPFSALPPVLRSLSRLIPLAHGVDAFRSTLMGYPPGFPELAPIEVELAVVIGFGLAMPAAGYVLYRLAEGHARQTGSFSEY